MSYQEFLARKALSEAPRGFDPAEIHPRLFPFQAALTRWALRRGRAGLYCDTGLGKTIMQVEWAHQIARHTQGDVIILAPLAVAHQTVREAAKFGLLVRYCREPGLSGVIVTNYEMMERFDLSQYAGVVLDESSILKHHDAKTRTALIEACKDVPYRLSCTATPAPNDHMELANQAEFLGVMRRAEMLSMFFTHDGGDTSSWRLKKHARHRFWEWMATWAAVVRKPSDLGFEDAGFDLPPLEIREHVVSSSMLDDGELFPRAALNLMEQRRAQRGSIADRVAEVADLVNRTPGSWIIWCHLNDESDELERAIDGAVAVRGSHSISDKESRLEAFSSGAVRVLITKPSIAGFGMNWRHCHQVAFVGLSHSFEQFYQAIRRCWRFGQDHRVTAHLFTAESEGQVMASIKRKEAQHREMADEMAESMSELTKAQIADTKPAPRSVYREEDASGGGWDLKLGDCVERIREIEDESIGYTIFSPPFASLYTYSDSDRDMGNCTDRGEFAEHFAYLVPELLRATIPGRLCSFHCQNMQTLKQREGYIGLMDFRGDLIRAFIAAGWIYHSEVCIWKDPVTAMQRTKALGLLHKQIKKDSCMSRMGLPDYVVTMRKPGENQGRVGHTGEDYPVEKWQRIASPVWMDINMSRTLNNYREGREDDDERHIAPLQLEVIERCLELWSNPGDLVLSPFAGIGSEGYVAIQMGRRFVGIELKPSYFAIAAENLGRARLEQGQLFA